MGRTKLTQKPRVSGLYGAKAGRRKVQSPRGTRQEYIPQRASYNKSDGMAGINYPKPKICETCGLEEDLCVCNLPEDDLEDEEEDEERY